MVRTKEALQTLILFLSGNIVLKIMQMKMLADE